MLQYFVQLEQLYSSQPVFHTKYENENTRIDETDEMRDADESSVEVLHKFEIPGG